ncbi:MAG: undecaprenyldiphospho-muramoylpentapeptide beta-N-acetylglucosaminyltransferase [Desulfobulbaceae bacterium]|nr:MAG: undecaprenyldiphospho-muramoylpentapeptide beta-N-acetylglucosaminyltransferase [Desulfobulbaceae bacterium]
MSKAAESESGFRLLVTGGGTGGHLFPAVAAAQQLRVREPTAKILFIGTRRKLDRNQLERYGFRVETIHSMGLKGKKLKALVSALLILPVSLVQALIQIIRFRPHLVLGVGGYVTGPVVAAAWLLRIPTVIHEQNSVPGMANRKLAKLVDKICISMECSKRFFPIDKTVFTGNPVRSQIIELRDQNPLDQQTPTILVLGGSQGAHSVNKVVVNAIKHDLDRFKAIKIIHQTGKADESWVAEAYREMGIKAEVSAFFNQMESIYGSASLVISRAGATTLAELAVVGIPAILIPYPYAADNHQEINSLEIVDKGGGVMIPERELEEEALSKMLQRLLDSPDEREKMSAAIKLFGIVEAADRIIDECLKAGRK